MIPCNRYREREPPEVCDRCQKKFIGGSFELSYLIMTNGKYEKKWICGRKECWLIERAFEENSRSRR